MSKGILIFAHNNGQVNYGKMAYITAMYAKKNLEVPVSLITDRGTKRWMIDQDNIPVEEVFDQIIIPNEINFDENQNRRYYDGSLEYKKGTFKNGYRASAYDLSPYDQTLVIDVDLLIVNDYLKHVWEDEDSDFMINRVSFDLSRDRNLYEFQYVSDHGIDFFWATAFYFKKTNWTKRFFDLCQHIMENYEYYRFVYRINNSLMRNDYIFSIAIHIMGGFSNKINPPSLPCEIYYTLDRDELLKVNNDRSFTFLIQKKGRLGEYTLARTDNQNVHIMNKFSIERHSKLLLEALDAN